MDNTYHEIKTNTSNSSANDSFFNASKSQLHTLNPPALQLKATENSSQQEDDGEFLPVSAPFQFEAAHSDPNSNSIKRSLTNFHLKAAIETSDSEAEGLAETQPYQLAAVGGETPSENSGSGSGDTPPNNTGLPNQLKSGVENLSGYSLDDVKVHYNSPKPAQLQAHAYAQGSDIHVASGQEKHLPHEAWHVVQQKQGRVQPTTQMKGIGVNDDSGLEKEADVMGAKANQFASSSNNEQFQLKENSGFTSIPPIQRKIDWTVDKLTAGDEPEYELTKKDYLRFVTLERNYFNQVKQPLDTYEKLEPPNKEDKVGYTWLFSLDLAIEGWNSKKEDFKDKASSKFNINTDKHDAVLTSLRSDVRKESESIFPKLNDNINEIKKLGEGSIGETSIVDHDGDSKVWKEETLPKGKSGPARAPASIEIPFYGAHLSNRAVASSKVDKDILGDLSVIVKAELAISQGKVGQVQEFLDGDVLDEIESKEKVQLLSKPNVVRDLFHLQLLDYLTEQVDRHAGNIMVMEDGIKGFDSDFSFGSRQVEDVKNKTAMGVYNKLLPKYISKTVAAKILSYKPVDLENKLDDLLFDQEIKAALERLLILQNSIKDGTIKTVNDWGKLTEKIAKLRLDPGGYFEYLYDKESKTKLDRKVDRKQKKEKKEKNIKEQHILSKARSLLFEDFNKFKKYLVSLRKESGLEYLVKIYEDLNDNTTIPSNNELEIFEPSDRDDGGDVLSKVKMAKDYILNLELKQKLPSLDIKDEKGNRVIDTLFETKLAAEIYTMAPEVIKYHVEVTEKMSKTTGLYDKIQGFQISTQDNKVKDGTDIKKVLEESLPRTGLIGTDAYDNYKDNYDERRKKFPESKPGEGSQPRGRREEPKGFWEQEEGSQQGIMTPSTAKKYLGVGFWDKDAPQNSGGRVNKRPGSLHTNQADKEREGLKLPFVGGASGSMVYALAVFDALKPKGESRELFAISFATYMVRHQHHSFFEAMVPLNLSYSSKRQFYVSIANILSEHGYVAIGKRINEMIFNYQIDRF